MTFNQHDARHCACWRRFDDDDDGPSSRVYDVFLRPPHHQHQPDRTGRSRRQTAISAVHKLGVLGAKKMKPTRENRKEAPHARWWWAAQSPRVPAQCIGKMRGLSRINDRLLVVDRYLFVFSFSKALALSWGMLIQSNTPEECALPSLFARWILSRTRDLKQELIFSARIANIRSQYLGAAILSVLTMTQRVDGTLNINCYYAIHIRHTHQSCADFTFTNWQLTINSHSLHLKLRLHFCWL